MRRTLGIVAIATGLSLVTAGTAAAGATVSPTSLDFGGQALGTSSAPRPVTLTVTCDAGCAIPGGFYAAPSASGDFSQTSDCAAAIPVTIMMQTQSCTITVSFAPEIAGARAGTLTTGVVAGPVIGSGSPGPTVPLTGVGLAPPAATPPAKKKKCKKGRKLKRGKCVKTKK